MSYIKSEKSRGKTYYLEVEAYRNGDGKNHFRILRYLGSELPSELDGIPIGYHGAKLTDNKRVQVLTPLKLGMEDFLWQIGTIKGYKDKKGTKYIIVDFDEPIRGRKDWLLPREMLGNIKKRGNNGTEYN